MVYVFTWSMSRGIHIFLVAELCLFLQSHPLCMPSFAFPMIYSLRFTDIIIGVITRARVREAAFAAPDP